MTHVYRFIPDKRNRIVYVGSICRQQISDLSFVGIAITTTVTFHTKSLKYEAVKDSSYFSIDDYIKITEHIREATKSTMVL